MNNELLALQNRFGDRFQGMHLVALESVCWPVFRHSLKITVRENIALDALEEGLLRLVTAGVEQSEELASFLGCSATYVQVMATSLSRSSNNELPLPLAAAREGWKPTATTAEVLRLCERPSIAERNLPLYRDAIFGRWLSRDRRFQLLAPGDTDDPPSRWLGPIVNSAAEDGGIVPDVLQEMSSTNSQGEVLATELSSSGSLQWLRLKLACYQSEDLRSGRFLLFNSMEEDEPLPDLSADFERLLGSGEAPQLYFPDDAVATGASFWKSLAARIRILDTSQELAAKQEHFELIRVAFNARRLRPKASCQPEEASQDSSAQCRTVGSTVNPTSQPQAQEHVEPDTGPTATIEPAGSVSESATAEADAPLNEALQKYEAEIEELRKALANAPVTRHLETKDHPPLLKESIKAARETVLIISPWIKMRVLRNLLPDLDDALGRGCEVWIGYGMPPSTMHKDKSDPEAIDALRSRAVNGLRLVDMWTHEKVLVVDDELYVNTSFNWLSYSGGDGRRESGLLQRGGVHQFRERFLADLKRKYEKAHAASA